MNRHLELDNNFFNSKVVEEYKGWQIIKFTDKEIYFSESDLQPPDRESNKMRFNVVTDLNPKESIESVKKQIDYYLTNKKII